MHRKCLNYLLLFILSLFPISVCPPGSGGINCEPCLADTYKSDTSNDNCTPIPDNSSANADKTGFSKNLYSWRWCYN